MGRKNTYFSTEKRKTRREKRKNRTKLQPGDRKLAGEVVLFDSVKLFGFIRPFNGAANIHFTMCNVPHNRKRCVGEGRTVYFDVILGVPIIRKKSSRPTLTAKIR